MSIFCLWALQLCFCCQCKERKPKPTSLSTQNQDRHPFERVCPIISICFRVKTAISCRNFQADEKKRLKTGNQWSILLSPCGSIEIPENIWNFHGHRHHVDNSFPTKFYKNIISAGKNGAIKLMAKWESFDLCQYITLAWVDPRKQYDTSR